MSYRPGDVFYKTFTVNNISGASTDADITPWSRISRNGIDDNSAYSNVSKIDVGRYVVSGIFPSTYAKGYSVNVIISGYFGGILQKQAIDMGVLDSMLVGDIIGANGIIVSVTGTVQANVVSVSGSPVAPGVSGSILADFRYLNGLNFTTYDGIAQTGTRNSIRLSNNASSVDNYYNGQYVSIVGGTAQGQIGLINSYSGSTRDAYISTWNSGWSTIPYNDSQYVINGMSLNCLYSGGLDKITVENNVNARQMLSIIGSFAAGSSVVTGNNITYYAVNNNAVQRITSTAVSGARQAIVVFLP